MKLPKKLHHKLEERKETNSLRSLKSSNIGVDFCSNDYLGFSGSKEHTTLANDIYKEHAGNQNGATGSRLLSGNHKLHELVEQRIAQFHKSETALLFNSGYDANLGFLQAVPQRGDIILYDALVHASIRDGIQMSHAKAYKFDHNDIEDLKRHLSVRAQSRTIDQQIYVITESVFSMDGDSPDLIAITQLCQDYNCHLVVDEAHALGVVGSKGQGLVQELQLQETVFARIVTFGKALGAHGAAILGSKVLQEYLINFARPFIYTTALPPHSAAAILAGYTLLQRTAGTHAIKTLHHHIQVFQEELKRLAINTHFITSNTAIQAAIIPNNERVLTLSQELTKAGFEVLPIRSPTVPKGSERLRFCLHSFNTVDEIKNVLSLLKTMLKE